MKKCLTVLVLFLSFLPCFAQGHEINNSLEESESDFKISLLDEKLLIHQPNSSMFTQYRTPNGKIFSNKEMKAMLLEIPENKSIMKSYNFWRGFQYSLIGTSLASILVCTVYTVADSAPYAEKISTISGLTGILTCCISLPSMNVANLKYVKAVDNYNLSLLRK